MHRKVAFRNENRNLYDCWKISFKVRPLAISDRQFINRKATNLPQWKKELEKFALK